MIYSKAKIYGLEKKVLLIQRYLDAHLPEYWNGELSIYNVIQPTLKNGNIIPSVYHEKDEHQEIFFNDLVAAVIAFNVQSRAIKNNQHSAIVDVVFNLNMYRIHSNTLRETERALLEAHKLLRKCSFINDITGIKEGAKESLSKYYINTMNQRDMQPYYTFAFTCSVIYSENLC